MCDVHMGSQHTPRYHLDWLVGPGRVYARVVCSDGTVMYEADEYPLPEQQDATMRVVDAAMREVVWQLVIGLLRCPPAR